MRDKSILPALMADLECLGQFPLIKWFKPLLQTLSLKTHAAAVQIFQTPRKPKRMLAIATEMQDLSIHPGQGIGTDAKSTIWVEISHPMDQAQTTLLNQIVLLSWISGCLMDSGMMSQSEMFNHKMVTVKNCLGKFSALLAPLDALNGGHEV
tara:strand:- start:2615 stop:3070 length:456 start_codon:yes stop_codon:yes gene_type:complete